MQIQLSKSIRAIKYLPTILIMGEKVKVNKTDRQLLSNLIYTLLKYHILYCTECIAFWGKEVLTEETGKLFLNHLF